MLGPRGGDNRLQEGLRKSRARVAGTAGHPDVESRSGRLDQGRRPEVRRGRGLVNPTGSPSVNQRAACRRAYDPAAGAGPLGRRPTTRPPLSDMPVS